MATIPGHSKPMSTGKRAQIPRCVSTLGVLLVALSGGWAAADPTLVVPPLPLPGPYPVACSDVAQDFSRVQPGENAQNYWDGTPRDDGSGRYITDLLTDPNDTLELTLAIPTNSQVYGSFAGSNVPYVVIVCYPTTADNPRPDYPLPNGVVVPHMQRAGDAPLLADPTAHFPVLLFSHGLQGSPLDNEYLQAIEVPASYGYVVAATFHGDARFSPLQLNDLADVVYLLTHLSNVVAFQAVRPISLSATLDLLLANPQWNDHVDPAQIGGFGASLGGEALMLMAGAGLTTSAGLSWTQVDSDARLKAAVGYVPYFGQPVFPAFGRDQNGLNQVTLPYLAISGTADTIAPIAETIQGLQHVAGPRELVELVGVTHGFDVPSTNDIFTWTLTFLDAQVRGDPVASARLLQMASVAGGGDDHVVIPYNGPAATNYGGLWWNAPAGSEAGWGINFAHQGDVIFATWLTYDGSGRAWWLSMTAPKTLDGNYSGTIYQTNGPAFSAVPFDPHAVSATAVGSGTLTFSDPNNGTFNYTVNGVAQSKAITREVFGPLPTCVFGTQPNLAAATNYQDLWWNPAESGWGINLTQQGSTIFATWFTYDQSGNPLWLSVTAAPQNGGYTGILYQASGPPFDAVPFNPAQVALTPVGSATLTFADGNNATFAYSALGVSQSKAITRQVFQSPGTVCR
jgi:predicted dienelactone hydrolase